MLQVMSKTDPPKTHPCEVQAMTFTLERARSLVPHNGKVLSTATRWVWLVERIDASSVFLQCDALHELGVFSKTSRAVISPCVRRRTEYEILHSRFFSRTAKKISFDLPYHCPSSCSSHQRIMCYVVLSVSLVIWLFVLWSSIRQD